MNTDTQKALCKICLWTAMESTNGQCAFPKCVFSHTGEIWNVNGYLYDVYADRISGKRALAPLKFNKA